MNTGGWHFYVRGPDEDGNFKAWLVPADTSDQPNRTIKTIKLLDAHTQSRLRTPWAREGRLSRFLPPKGPNAHLEAQTSHTQLLDCQRRLAEQRECQPRHHRGLRRGRRNAYGGSAAEGVSATVPRSGRATSRQSPQSRTACSRSRPYGEDLIRDPDPPGSLYGGGKPTLSN